MSNTALIIGASSGLGRSIAETAAANGNDVIVCSRNKKELELLATHLNIRYSVKTYAIELDLTKITNINAIEFVNDCLMLAPQLSQVYITAGIIDDEDKGEKSVLYLHHLMQVNCTSICYILSEFCNKLKDTSSIITIISSIAAIRARGMNIAYGTSKIALEYFVKGIRHFYANKPIVIQLYRAGYMNTALSRGKKLMFPIAETDTVATRIYKNRNKDFGMRYIPAFWWPISLILHCVPWSIYKNMKF